MAARIMGDRKVWPIERAREWVIRELGDVRITFADETYFRRAMRNWGYTEGAIQRAVVDIYGAALVTARTATDNVEQSKTIAVMIAEYEDRHFQAEQSIADTMGVGAEPTGAQRRERSDAAVALEAAHRVAKAAASIPPDQQRQRLDEDNDLFRASLQELLDDRYDGRWHPAVCASGATAHDGYIAALCDAAHLCGFSLRSTKSTSDPLGRPDQQRQGSVVPLGAQRVVDAARSLCLSREWDMGSNDPRARELVEAISDVEKMPAVALRPTADVAREMVPNACGNCVVPTIFDGAVGINLYSWDDADRAHAWLAGLIERSRAEGVVAATEQVATLRARVSELEAAVQIADLGIGAAHRGCDLAESQREAEWQRRIDAEKRIAELEAAVARSRLLLQVAEAQLSELARKEEKGGHSWSSRAYRRSKSLIGPAIEALRAVVAKDRAS